ncbi:MAG: response regulator [Treponema sp.]|jgi:putative two-component system response regulator|nr:response regulator [Treponema sp.]
MAEKMQTIFVVDDSDVNLAMTKRALEHRYRIMTVPSAGKMFTLLEKVTPDLILLDIEMPVMNGFEALRQLKANPSFTRIPVIFLTAIIDPSIEVRGFELGVVDFITKPFSTPVLLNRINTYLNIEDVIRDRTEKLRRMQNGIVYVLADVVENRDKATHGHIERTSEYLKLIITKMKEAGVYLEQIQNWDVETIVWSARLHDIGKISIPDVILNKPGDLTDEEFIKIKSHALEGERIIDDFAVLTDGDDFLKNAKLFAGHHHEHWDGNGYPRGLKGADISLQGRIMAVVDVYDTLVSKRSYKKALTPEEAVIVISDNAGKQFDPAIVEVFLSVEDQFLKIREGL